MNPIERNGERITQALLLQAERFDWRGLNFPIKLEDITKFEKQNLGISVNVFGFEKEVFPLRISKHSGRNVDLIMIGNGKKIIMM